MYGVCLGAHFYISFVYLIESYRKMVRNIKYGFPRKPHNLGRSYHSKKSSSLPKTCFVFIGFTFIGFHRTHLY